MFIGLFFFQFFIRAVRVKVSQSLVSLLLACSVLQSPSSINTFVDRSICGAVSDIPCDDTVQGQSGKIRAAAESASKSKESSSTKQSSLVQATISTMFKKVEKPASPDRVNQRKTTKTTSNKGTSNKGYGSDTCQGEDDIEEFSSSSKDTEASDEDWAA